MEDVKFLVNKRIDIWYEDKIYKSIIQDITDKYIAIGLPVKDGVYITPKHGETFEVMYYDELTVYKFDGLITGRITENKVPQLLIAYPKVVKQVQRREFVRVEVLYYVDYLKVDHDTKDYFIDDSFEEHKCKKGILLDLSGGGFKLKINDKVKLGELVFVEIPMEQEVLRVCGEAVRTDLDDDGKYICGFSFKELENRTREKIIRQIFELMRKQRKTV